MSPDTTGATLRDPVHRFTRAHAQVYTDELDSYHHLHRLHATVCHSDHEWARDEDGEGIREVHINTDEGMWTGLRNFLRPFRGVSKHFLYGYVAVYEFCVNLKGCIRDLGKRR